MGAPPCGENLWFDQEKMDVWVFCLAKVWISAAWCVIYAWKLGFEACEDWGSTSISIGWGILKNSPAPAEFSRISAKYGDVKHVKHVKHIETSGTQEMLDLWMSRVWLFQHGIGTSPISTAWVISGVSFLFRSWFHDYSKIHIPRTKDVRDVFVETHLGQPSHVYFKL